MTYRTPENKIREIMMKSAQPRTSAGPISESTTSVHMEPADKTSDEDRISTAIKLLHDNGVASAEKRDKAVSISAGDANKAADILDRAVVKGMLSVKPHLVSAESIPMPEPHVPAPEFAKEEEDKTEINQGSVDDDGNVKLQPRSLRNRTENQIKKIDEDKTPKEVDREINDMARDILNRRTTQKEAPTVDVVMNDGTVETKGLGLNVEEEAEQIDELSTETLHKVANVARKKGRKDVLNAAIKANQRNRQKPQYELPKEEIALEFDPSKQQLDELSLQALTKYQRVAKKPVDVKSMDAIDKRINRLKSVSIAKGKIAKKVSKALFGEEVTPGNMILRVRKQVLSEGKGRLMATLNSECGNHKAKIYRDSEWNEHRVEFHINGKHHEPGDSFHSDYEDAHGTAKFELKRLTKLNGALKEAAEEGTNPFDIITEVSSGLLHRYINASKKQGASGYGYNHVGKTKEENDRAFKRMKGVAKAHEIIQDRKKPIRAHVHDLTHMSHGEVYDHTQVHDSIKDGDVLKVKGGTAMMYKAWPTMVHGDSDVLHHFKDDTNLRTVSRGRYAKTADVADSLKGK